MAAKRRGFLKGLMACPVCAAPGFVAGEAGAADEHGAWSYEGANGPADWGKNDPAARVCSLGDQQSPVDLSGGIRAALPGLALNWPARRYEITNNGHTIQCNAEPGDSLQVGRVRYELLQFHFHTPSEHAVAGKRMAMEAHFVHKGPEGALAVLGVLMQPGPSNAAFKAIMAAAPIQPGRARLAKPIDIRSLVPAAPRRAWRYEGSLTTPPCSEVVSWFVLDRPVSVAENDIAAFRRIYATNARPLQPLHRRFLLLG
jgi:carbonic anhydrase